ncbi:hypothetical protein RJ639_006708, partial [Escallonia herrerae]
MRRYSPPYYSPPRRGYGGRPQSPPRRGSPLRRGSPPPRRGYGGGGGDYGRRKDQNQGSLLVRNIPPEELRAPFERFGVVRDVYLPKNYYTGEPRGFAFVQFVDPYEAAEAQYHMNGKILAGREISVVLAAETRKRPEEMRRRTRDPLALEGDDHPSTFQTFMHNSVGRSRSRSRSPRYTSGSRGRHRSRSYSPAPRRQTDYSLSPERRDHPRSPRDSKQERDDDHTRRSYSPGYENADENGNGYGRKSYTDAEDPRARWKSSPGRASRSPSGSRS